MRGLAACLLALLLAPAAAQAQDCRDLTHAGNVYAICEIHMTGADLRLFLYDDTGDLLGHFSTVNAALAPTGKTLAFAMNAGMYHEDRAPVGHYLENGIEQMRVITTEGPGNFGLLPNGVFCIREGRADVIETLTYVEDQPACAYATQSGPMLVIDGELHPRFLIDSTSRYIRNGVGTNADGTRAVFAISRNAVTFHEFGSMFRDALNLPNALYFDGNISRLYAPSINRNDLGFRLGPMVGLVVDAD
ncbi:phosphodiester glycosidase family protein [Sedimentitalea todarodis]|uniref:Phosphodiester glycosidase family protein n=1 Tax=Sedimentitalea todarodis TaxID=1631240 RepID=A0ABU3VA45_9RHOB|nr:phosphodiester glycosidase family protein [Sedimentitalea todarodis]MDU9003045.1 phosphodiester glycosidase family protein [Sedimentitalea todarodis]